MPFKFYTTLFACILLLSACHQEASKNEIRHQDTIPVKVIPVTPDTISTTFHSSGYFTTNNETPLSFKNGGIINKIYVREGDAFQKGQLLATVYGKEVNAASRQASLALKKAQRDYRRAHQLYLDSVATLEQKQNAKTALRVAQQRMAAARFNNKQSKIVARHAGVVLEKYLNEGQMAPPGQPVFLVNNTSNRGWVFKTGVSDYQWASIKKGDTATVVTDAAPGIKIKGSVLKKSQGVDPQSGSFTLQIALPSHLQFHPASGLFGKATLYPSVQSRGYIIPYDALLDGDENSGYVFVTNDKKTAQKVKVSIGSISSNGVLIKKGLQQGEYVIISGSAYLKDGSSIQIIH